MYSLGINQPRKLVIELKGRHNRFEKLHSPCCKHVSGVSPRQKL